MGLVFSLFERSDTRNTHNTVEVVEFGVLEQ